MTTTPNPAQRTHGLGEIIRAHRMYIGLSQREMADQLAMARRSYQRIETGVDPCPRGLLDTIDTLVDTFDKDVAEAIKQAEAMANADQSVSVVVSDSETATDAWLRAVVGRACVESGLISPTLSGMSQTRAAG